MKQNRSKVISVIALGLFFILGLIGTRLISALQVGACPAISTLPCDQIKLSPSLTFTFDGNDGGLTDHQGIDLGFTMVDPPSNPGNQAANLDAPGYWPEKLSVANGNLVIAATQGINHADVNTLDNGLGVGLDLDAPIVLETTLKDIHTGPGGYAQAGLWFGLSTVGPSGSKGTGTAEDNFIKFVIVSNWAGSWQVHALREENGINVRNNTSQAVNTDDGITLRLELDPATTTATTRFCVGSNCDAAAAPVFYTFTDVPNSWFSADAATIDLEVGTASMGGIFATQRKATTEIAFTFSQFVYEEEAANTPPPSPSDIEFTAWQFSTDTPTALAWGPDNRLYAASVTGQIYAYTIDHVAHAAHLDEVIDAVAWRLVLGLAIDPASTPNNVILWVSHSDLVQSQAAANSGMISMVSGPGFSVRDDVITGLPRSVSSHATNHIHFGSDGRLYIAQSGNTGAGAAIDTPNSEFGSRPEQPLSAAILVADVNTPGFDGSCASEIDPDGAIMDTTGLAATDSPCDVAVYASGLRNSYDFVFHSNGEMYATDNGLGVLSSFPPLIPSQLSWTPGTNCEGLLSDASVIAANDPGERPDLLYRVEAGKYYGHPNPVRGECVFFGGNPTAGFDYPVNTTSALAAPNHVEVTKYDVGVLPDPNWVEPMFSFGMRKSANGIIEYQSDAFCGALQGDLLVTYYSQEDQIRRLTLAANGRSIVGDETLAGTTIQTGGVSLAEPLALVEDNDGRLYVAEFGGGRIRVFEPVAINCNATSTPTPQVTPSSTPQATATASPTPPATSTAQPTATSTSQPTATSTSQPTPIPTSTESPAPTLLLHWPFDEADEILANDASGNGRTGYIHGATWDANGHLGGALYFDGTGNYVEESNASSYLNGLEAFTISVWVRSMSTSSDRGILHVTQPNGADDVLTMRYDAAGWAGGGWQLIKTAVSTTHGYTQMESDNNVQTTEWQHLVLVWEAGQPLRLYIDGSLDQPTYLGPVRTGVTSNVVTLLIGKGAKDIQANQSWHGWIDDVRLYEGALSATEVQALFTD